MVLSIKINPKIIILTFVLLMVTGMAYGQKGATKRDRKSDPATRTISGRVTFADGSPVTAATIMLRGTTNGTASDLDGNWALRNVPEKGGVVIVSFIGYQTQVVEIDSKSVYDISLSTENVIFQDVIDSATEDGEPRLVVEEIAFSEKVVKAGNQVNLIVELTNEGESKTSKTFVMIYGEAPGLSYTVRNQFPTIWPGETERLEIPIRGNVDLTNSKVDFNLDIEVEESGTHLTEQTISLYTQASSNELETEESTRGGGGAAETNRFESIGSYHALLIGVQNYEDSKIKQLSYPISDVQKVKETLSEHYTFNQENITTLIDPDRSEILDAFDQLSEQLAEDDNLLIFFAGHGKWAERNNQGYWLPADAHHKRKANWVSNSTIRDGILAINTQHTLLISDACFSGGIFQGRDTRLVEDVADLYKLKSRRAITSGTKNEVVPDKSEFTRYFLKTLLENEDEVLDSQSLFTKIRIPVSRNTDTTPQDGYIKEADDEGGDFIFVKRKRP